MKLIDLSDSETSLKSAADHAVITLREGKVMIAPTETAYGLLADAENPEAVASLFKLKGRSADKTSAIFVNSTEDLKRYGVELDRKRQAFIRKFWPGPVTFVFKSNMGEWKGILSAEGKIGFRCSSHPVIKAILSGFRKAITATSANISGRIINSLEELKSEFSGKVDLFVVDPDLDFNSLPSTVVELDKVSLKILREGSIPSTMIKEAFTNA